MVGFGWRMVEFVRFLTSAYVVVNKDFTSDSQAQDLPWHAPQPISAVNVQ